MKRKRAQFFSLIATWPSGFSLLEILILLIGIGVGIFIYLKMNQIRTDAMNASSFDQETNEILLSTSLSYIHFNELMAGTSSIDLQKDIYSQLDNADSICQDIEQGGPSGKFVPLSQNTKNANSQPPSICTQLTQFRTILIQRWQDHLDGKPDIKAVAYEATFSDALESLQRFQGIADPHIQQAETQTRNVNLALCIGLTGIFFLVAFILWRTRKTLTGQTKQLEREIEVSSRLNTDLDSERNLLNTLLDAIPDAVFAKDRENRFIIANPAAAHVMGEASKEDLIGKTEADFQPADVSEKIIANDTRIFETGESKINLQEQFIDLDTGNPRWRQTTKVALRDRNGKITGLVGISRDITKQKETEEALKKTNDKLITGIADLEQTSRETEHLSEMVDLLQACPNTEEACLVIADQLSKFFPEDSGILYLLHASRNLLDRAASWGPALPDTLMFKPDDCWGLRRGRMHIVEANPSKSDQADLSHSLICPHITPDEPADYLCVPLVAQGEALGLLHLHHKVKPEEQLTAGEWYNHAKRQRIHTIVDSLSLSLANLKLRSTLRQQSIRDPLTGMFNRRYMEETLEREILRSTRNNEPVGVIMLDIDYFKMFNDNFGHQAGDVLLQSLGHFFLSNVRGEDVACRYGGEEFILLLPGSPVEKTRLRAEELREKIHYLNVNFQGQSLGTITLSFGVSVFPDHGLTPEMLVQAADQALYRAKTEGRDRVVVA